MDLCSPQINAVRKNPIEGRINTMGSASAVDSPKLCLAEATKESRHAATTAKYASMTATPTVAAGISIHMRFFDNSLMSVVDSMNRSDFESEWL